jgi:hypothetical protein
MPLLAIKGHYLIPTNSIQLSKLYYRTNRCPQGDTVYRDNRNSRGCYMHLLPKRTTPHQKRRESIQCNFCLDHNTIRGLFLVYLDKFRKPALNHKKCRFTKTAGLSRL